MTPNAGDVVWVERDPVRGSEQAGRRPGLVITDEGYQRRTRRVLICPITRSTREWTFHVPIPPGLRVTGAVMADQIRMVDHELRVFGYIDTLPPGTVAEVRARLAVLIGVAAGP